MAIRASLLNTIGSWLLAARRLGPFALWQQHSELFVVLPMQEPHPVRMQSTELKPNKASRAEACLAEPGHNPPTSVWHKVLLLSGVAYLIWSGWHPNGRFNWLMESGPAILGAIALAAVYRRFRFTTVSYVLVWFFSLILMTGGHYTYAEVPLGNWARDAFGLSRNHFDRLGHIFQGVIPALLVRELLLRTTALRPGKWLFVLAVSVALAISAAYELFEWQYAVMFGGKQADDFLGSQGDIWDAQKDMFMALCGSVFAQIALGRLQLKQMARGTRNGGLAGAPEFPSRSGEAMPPRS